MADAKNLGSPFAMKIATTVWMGQHQKFDFILNDLDFEKNRLCTGNHAPDSCFLISLWLVDDLGAPILLAESSIELASI